MIIRTDEVPVLIEKSERLPCACGREFVIGITYRGKHMVIHDEPACPEFAALRPIEWQPFLLAALRRVLKRWQDAS